MMPEMEMVKDAALKYDKPTLGRMAQMGQISPTVAVMAGMMRDRIVQSEMKPPAPPTVAEEIMQPMGQRMGLGAIAPGMGQPQQPQGIDQIPVPDQMFEPQGMAGGGVVAFDNGGSAMFTGSPLGQNVRGLAQVSPRTSNIFAPGAVFFQYMTDDEKRIYEATGVVPESTKQRYQQQASKQAIQPSFIGALSGQQAVQPSVEDIIAQAQRGEGPNVSRPAAPADVAVVPPGGPVIPRPTAIAESAPARSVVKKPEGEKKPSSIFDEATNAANKLKAYKTQFGLTDADPDAALRAKLSELQKGSKDERREAAYMAMIMAGLGIAGGTSPYFAVNLKEAIPALKEFGVAKRDIKKAEMEYTKMEADLNRAADARKRGDMELALGLEENSKNRELRLRQVIAAERAANKPSQLRELIDMASRGDPNKAQQYAVSMLSARGKNELTANERATLRQNALKNAAAELKNNREYGRLANSKDPADRAKAQKIRNDVIAQYMDVERSGLGGSNSALFDEADAILGLK